MIQQAYKYISSSLWHRLAFFELKVTDILKSSGWGLEKSESPWEQNFYSHRRVSCRTISLPSFNGLFIYLRHYWVEYMMSSVISFAYFTHFSNLNISGTNADFGNEKKAFLFFHGILCDTPKISRGKNLIIVPL